MNAQTVPYDWLVTLTCEATKTRPYCAARALCVERGPYSNHANAPCFTGTGKSCGIEISLYYARQELQEVHREWRIWTARKFNKGKRLVVPAAELEQLDLETETPIWSCFYRAGE